MNPTNYLIIGGRSEAGQSATEAIREFHRTPEGAPGKTPARIIGTSSSPGTGEPTQVPGIDHVIDGIDLNDAQCVAKIQNGLRAHDQSLANPGAIDVLFFTPAFGPIGYPIRAATVPDADAAIQFSVTPMRDLSDALQPRLSVGYSAFYWLPHALVGYGSMAYAKVMLDTLAHTHPERYRVIRGGTFRSPATRGIGLLLQRALKSTPHAELRELGERHKAAGGKFSDFFFDFAFTHEATAFGERFVPVPHRATERADLQKATLQILRNEITAPVVGVIGDWLWPETEMPPLDAGIFQIKDLVLRKHGL